QPRQPRPPARTGPAEHRGPTTVPHRQRASCWTPLLDHLPDEPETSLSRKIGATMTSLRRAASSSRGGSLVLPPRPGWRDLAGRCWHTRPPAASTPPTNSAPEPATAGDFIHGRLRWLHRLPLAALRHAAVSTVPRFQGQ